MWTAFCVLTVLVWIGLLARSAFWSGWYCGHQAALDHLMQWAKEDANGELQAMARKMLVEAWKETEDEHIILEKIRRENVLH